MKYKIACVGKIKEDYFTKLIDGYRKEINKRDSLEICESLTRESPRKMEIG